MKERERVQSLRESERDERSKEKSAERYLI